MPSAVTLQEIKDATATDETLQNLARVITTQKWHEVGKDVGQYQQIKQELSVSNDVTASDYVSPQWTSRHRQDEAFYKY